MTQGQHFPGAAAPAWGGWAQSHEMDEKIKKGGHRLEATEKLWVGGGPCQDQASPAQKGIKPPLPLPSCPSLSSLWGPVASGGILSFIYLMPPGPAMLRREWGVIRGDRRPPLLWGTDFYYLNTGGPCLLSGPLCSLW